MHCGVEVTESSTNKQHHLWGLGEVTLVVVVITAGPLTKRCCLLLQSLAGRKTIAVRAFLRIVLVLWLVLESYGTLVASSAPLVMPLHDSDIPMNVPITSRNKQTITLGRQRPM